MEQELENVEETQQETTMEQTEQTKFQSADDDSVIKIDLSKPPQDEEPEQETTDSTTDNEGVVGSDENAEPVQEQEEVQPEAEAQEQPALEEITEEESKAVAEEVKQVEEQVEQAVAEAEETGEPLPENLQSLVEFLNDTGGTIEDYVLLNRDFTKVDDMVALREYYARTKSHLSADEVDFLIEENFSYDEDVDEEKDIKRKKIALKEQVAEAKSFLENQKSKYYEDIKAGSKLTQEQQKAIDFFNRYNKESEEIQKRTDQEVDHFLNKTNAVFNDKFKGFEYNVGEKKYRFNVNDAAKVKEVQSDVNNYIRKFLNEDGLMEDAAGYHKGLFTAMNSDAIAKHFYEQGKADALKESIAKSKNVDMNPRQQHKEFEGGGIKFRVVGDDASDYKFKIRSKK